MQDNNTPTPFIDFEDVWNQLKPELDKEAATREKRKKRFVIFWFTFIAFAIGGTFFVINKDKPSSNKEVIAKQFKVNETATTNRQKNEIVNSKNVDKEYEKIDPNSMQINEQNTTVISNTKIAANEKTKRKNVSAKPKTSKYFNGNTELVFSKSKASKNKFVNAKSYANIIALKADVFGNETYTQQAIASNSSKESIEELISETQAEKEQESKIATTSLIENKTDNKPAKALPRIKKKQKQFSYGLLWNTAIRNGINYVDINAKNNFLTQFIPQFWVAKQFGKKHTLLLGLNPYSQYYLNNKAIVNASQYDVTIYSGSQINIKPEKLLYTEITSFNKLISLEASLTYQYQLSTKIKVGLGVSNNWIQGALMQNKVVKNNNIITRDSIYGIDNNDKEWSYLKPSFFQGKLELNYQIKKIDMGISLSKPIENVFNNISQNKTPINTNIYIRWRIR